jgi:hypothetical protein
MNIRWEYLVEMIDATMPFMDTEKYEAHLNDCGHEGWEFVPQQLTAHITNPITQQPEQKMVLVFKRPFGSVLLAPAS